MTTGKGLKVNVWEDTLHQRLLEMASQAIRAVFSDQNVLHEQALKSLKLLRDEIDGWIDAIEVEIEREGGNE